MISAAGGTREGGSTLTQQLVRMSYLSQDRTLKRKVQEAVLALWLESQLPKDEILTRYLNAAYFGAGVYGADAAAQRYFGKPAKDLTLSEAAMLAGLVRAPSSLSPWTNYDGALARSHVVLGQMREQGFITPEQEQAAAARAAGETAEIAEAFRSIRAELDNNQLLTTELDTRLVGQIAAGGPILAEEAVEEVFPLPESLVGQGTLFMLKVKGDSMVDAAICDGDFVVIRQQPTCESGDIVAALIDDEATVKTFKKRDGHVWLMPHNPAFEPILGDNAVIMGKVVSVLRKI